MRNSERIHHGFLNSNILSKVDCEWINRFAKYIKICFIYEYISIKSF